MILCCIAIVGNARDNRPNVVIIDIDGARYSETFGAKDTYIPTIWNELRLQGTIYTNIRNGGITKTCPGHAAVLTGNWQNIANDGSERPVDATIFEYFRKQTSLPTQSCFVISGKSKLNVLTYGNDRNLGPAYGASFVGGDWTDIDTWKKTEATIRQYHPRLMIINLPEVDLRGHDSSWTGYLAAIRRADSIVGLIWKTIQSDSIYRNTTTMFVTNDHGRHDDQHGGFKSHGDTCDGCRHIMLLAVGPQFKKNAVVNHDILQVDLAPTSARLVGIKLPPVLGKSLLRK